MKNQKNLASFQKFLVGFFKMKIKIADTSHESLGTFSESKVDEVKFSDEKTPVLYTGDYIIKIKPEGQKDLDTFFATLFPEEYKILDPPRVWFILKKRKDGKILREGVYSYHEELGKDLLISTQAKQFLHFDMIFIPDGKETSESFMRDIFRRQ